MSLFFDGYVKKQGDQYWCQICVESFGTLSQVRKHCVETKKHEWCSFCERVFMTKDSLLQHQIYSYSHNICFLCPQQPDFSDDEYLQIHEEEEHFYCYECDDCFKTDEELTAHSLEWHYGCDVCGRGFSSEFARESHMKCHAPRELQCPYCDRDFVRFSHYLRHLEFGPCGSENRIYKIAFDMPGGYNGFYDSKHALFFCSVCSRDFDFPSGLFSHVEDSHGACKDLLGPEGRLTALKEHLKTKL